MEEVKSNREKVQKIKNIIDKEIEKELTNKQNEVTDISEKIKNVLRHLELLKYIVAVNYYDHNTTLLQKKSCQEDEKEDEKAQTQIHPCIKKLMPFRSNYNKSFGDLLSSHSYETRNSKKINFSESISDNKKGFSSNSSQEKCNSINNNLKVPQYIPPLPNEDEAVETINSTRGSMSKECYRVIVGNISKWIPPDTREDNSTHKWMVYIRNKDPNRDITKILKKVRYFLHESYKPHDIIDVTSSPFRLTRRGWGEFPIRVQLHFTHPLNKPIDIIHNLKLDMSCSGIQMLGGETVVEVCLHHDSVFTEKDISKLGSSLKIESSNVDESVKEKQDVFDETLLTNINGFKSNNCIIDIKKEDEIENVIIKQEPEECFENLKLLNSKMETMKEALSNSRKFLLDRRKIMKIIEIEHGYLKTNDSQLFYRPMSNFTNSVLNLEAVKNLHLEKILKNGAMSNSVQMNQCMNRKCQDRMCLIGVKPSKNEEEIFINLKAAANKMESESQSKYSMKTFRHMYLVNVIQRAHATKLKSVEGLIKWFVQRWPIITKLSLDPMYKSVHPYSSPNEEEFLKYNIGKQRSAEWFRAKAIQKVLKSLRTVVPIKEEIWSTKQIFLWSRFHGYVPLSYSQRISKIETRENELRNKRLKLNDSSSESDEESFDFSNKKFKTIEEKFLNGLNVTEKKRNHRKCKRKDFLEEGLVKFINYKEYNTCTEISDPQRFGMNQPCVLRSYNSPSEIDVVTVDENLVKETSSRKNEMSLSITTTPSNDILFNKFVCDTARQIGVKILEEETIPGVKTDAVSRVLSQCVSNFLDELLRRSLACAWNRNGRKTPREVQIVAIAIRRHRDWAKTVIEKIEALLNISVLPFSSHGTFSPIISNLPADQLIRGF